MPATVIRPRSVAVMALAAIAVATVVVASWWASSRGGSWDTPATQSARQSPPASGDSAVPMEYVHDWTTYPQVDQDTAVSQTLAGMPQQDFADVTIVSDTAKRDASPLLMHATMNAESTTSGSSQYAFWEACLAEGAIAERLAGDATDLAYVIEGDGIRDRYPDGSTKVEGGCGGDVRPGEVFGAQSSDITDEQIVTSVDAVLAEYDLTPDNVHVLRPLGPAVAIVATAGDVGAIKKQLDAVQDEILGDPYRYEGLFLEIRGADGTDLVTVSTALRAGTGGVSFAPGMDDEFGINHG